MDRDKIESIVPLLPMQNRFLWHSLNEQASNTKNNSVVQLTCTFTGLIDLVKLQKSWDYLVHKHQALRSSVHWENVPSSIQVVHKQVASDFLIVDTNQFPTVAAFREQEINQSIDLTQAPAHRLSVFRSSQTSFEITWSMSHVLIDGWSSAVVINEWIELYSSLSREQQPIKEEVLQLSDYSRWIKRQDRDVALRYWNEHLPQESSVQFLSQPEAASASPRRSMTGSLSVVQYENLKKCMADARISLNTIMQSCFATLLQDRLSTNPVVFATTVSGRHIDIPHIEKRVGMMINTSPVSISFDKTLNVETWLRNIQEQFYASLPHTHADPLDIAALRPNLNPLYDSLLVIENLPDIGYGSSDEIIVSNYQSALISDFSLTLAVIPSEDLVFEFRYSESRFNTEAIEALADNLKSFLINLPQYLSENLSILDAHKATSSTRYVASKFADKPQRSDSTQKARDATSTLLEKTLLDIWCHVLSVDHVQPNDNFFDLGGSSLQAIQIFEHIENKLNIQLPATTLFNAPTLNGLVDALNNDKIDPLWSSVIGINRSGGLIPIFIPFEQVDMLMYQELIASLGKEQPVYGLNISQDDYPSESVLDSLVEHIVKIYPSGPYQLAGLSGAGLVAWDLAQRLTGKSHTVSTVMLLDTYGPHYPQLLPPTRRLTEISVNKLSLTASLCKRVLQRLRSNLRQQKLIAKERQPLQNHPSSTSKSNFSHAFQQRVARDTTMATAMVRELSTELTTLRRSVEWISLQLARSRLRSNSVSMELIVLTQGLLLRTGKEMAGIQDTPEDDTLWYQKILELDSSIISSQKPATHQMLSRYQKMYANILPYSGRVLYCKASHRPAGVVDDPMVGWTGLLSGTARIEHVPGNHLSLLKQPNVQHLATLLSDEMAYASSEYKSRSS